MFMPSKFILTFSMTLMLIVTSCSSVKDLAYVPSNFETISAIKEVLNGSAAKALMGLAQSSGGIEAVLPDEVKPVIATLRTLGLGKEIDILDEKVGLASEVALIEGKGLMSDAISELKVTDGASIITGGENAATMALKNVMYAAVSKRYSERLDVELAKVDETKHWDTAVSTYNLFAKNKIEGSLSDFIAKRAVDAVFIAMGKEEAVIRREPSSLGKEVVTRVFNYYQDKK